MFTYMLYLMQGKFDKPSEGTGFSDPIDSGPSESLDTFLSQLAPTLCVLAIAVIGLSIGGVLFGSIIDDARNGRRK